MLFGGRLAAEGSAADLAALAGGEEVHLLGPSGDSVQTLATDGTAAGLAQALSSLEASAQQLRVEIRRPSLEDAFTHLTGGAAPSAIDSKERAA